MDADDDVAVVRAAAVILSNESVTVAMEGAITSVLVPVVRDSLGELADDIAELDARVSALERRRPGRLGK